MMESRASHFPDLFQTRGSSETPMVQHAKAVAQFFARDGRP